MQVDRSSINHKCLIGRRLGTLLFLDQLMVIVVVKMADIKERETEAVWKTPSLNLSTQL